MSMKNTVMRSSGIVRRIKQCVSFLLAICLLLGMVPESLQGIVNIPLVESVKAAKTMNAPRIMTDANDSHSHTWDDGVITTPATCRLKGVKTYTCTDVNCGETKTEEIPAIGHDWDDGVISIPPTTTTTGVKIYTCSICNLKRMEGIDKLPTSLKPGQEENVIPVSNITKTTLFGVKNIRVEKMRVTWKRNKMGDGYQIQYSTNSKFTSDNKIVTIHKNTIVSKTISKLKKGEKYYVRIRTYKTVSGKKYCSAWSNVKKVKITK